MLRRCLTVLSVLCLVLSSAGSVSAAVSYNVTDLGIVGCPQTIAKSINSRGDVTGYYSSFDSIIERAFVYRNGTTSDLGSLYEGARMKPMGINASGQIVGSAYTSSLGYRAFLYSNGTMTDLGKLPGDTSGIYDVQARAINDNGQIVGYSYINGTYHAFLYSDTGMADLGTPSGCSSSAANAINASGQVAGYGTTTDGVYHAFLYSGGRMTDLGTLGGSSSGATGINASGQVVGSASTDSASHAFLYTNGTMTDLGAQWSQEQSCRGHQLERTSGRLFPVR